MNDTEPMTVTRRKRIIYISIASLLVILGTLYAGFPWLVSRILHSQLAELGMQDVQAVIDYPGISQVSVRALSFHGPIGQGELKAEVPNIEVGYQLFELLVGRIQRVAIPEVNIQMQIPETQQKQSAQQTALPIGLLSGQWLADLPVEDLQVDRLQVNANRGKHNLYHLQLNTRFRERQLQMHGELSMPQIPQPLIFRAEVMQDGQTRVQLVSNVKGDAPLLLIDIHPADDAESQILKGQLHTKLDRLFPVMAPVLSSLYPSLGSAAGLKGDLSSQWQASLVNDQWQLKGTASIGSLAGYWNALNIPRSDWLATYQLIDTQFDANAILKSFDQKVRIKMSTKHDTYSGQGQTRFDLVPIEFNDDNMRLSSILKEWALPIDLTGGKLTASATMVWNDRLDIQGQIQLNKLAGHYHDTTFDGIDSTMALIYDKGLKTQKPVSMTVENIAAGFPISNTSLTFSLSPKPENALPIVHVTQFEAFMLGGRAHGGPFDYDFYREKNSLRVELEGLAIHDLMELEKQEGLVGDGLLDGSLPIEITNRKIVINEGTLKARQPGGAIQYTPSERVAALAKSNTSVDLIVKALSNFKYDVLDVNTNYLPDGDLHLKVRIQGHNPDWQGGQPINLNLNLEENIPTLLRSLQLSSEISEKVRKRVQEKTDNAR